MHATRIGLSTEIRKEAVDLLQSALADLIDLRLSVKQAHWTVVGTRFQQLHELFDSFVAPLDDEIDTIAERIATLGGTPDGRSVSVGQNSRLDTFPLGLIDGDVQIENLASRFALVGDAVRKSIDKVDAIGEADAADILTGVSRFLDKSLWFLEAHTKSPQPA